MCACDLFTTLNLAEFPNFEYEPFSLIFLYHSLVSSIELLDFFRLIRALCSATGMLMPIVFDGSGFSFPFYVEVIAGKHCAIEDAIFFMVCDFYVGGRFWSCRFVYWDRVRVIIFHPYCLTFSLWVQSGRLASCLDSNWAVNVAAHDDDHIFPSLHAAVFK